ncbi:MAG: S-layer homology domain-containing protein [Oscillospiraceae bacterium]|nr:S-layer homology domain-containing protein [Oscillospiraceae bacterium]
MINAGTDTTPDPITGNTIAPRMIGGLIYDNTATNAANGGGGVAVSGGTTFTMTDGYIRANNAVNGGGVFVNGSNARFLLQQNGVVERNVATALGGGIWLQDATLMMEGGTIQTNEALNGAGVSIQGNQTSVISGGTITGNTATANGGGVRVLAGLFTMEAGTISGNTAANDGGGIWLGLGDAATGARLNMTGGAITGNTATAGDGGGIFTSNFSYTDPVSYFTIYYTNIIAASGTFSGNSASSGPFAPPINSGDVLFGSLLTNFDINYIGGNIQITFILDGGTVGGIPDDIVEAIPLAFTIGAANAQPPVVRPGYVLIGWTMDDDPTVLTIAQVNALVPPAGTVFTAQWRAAGGNNGGGGNHHHAHEWFMMGYPDGTFRPYASITRAEVTAMLVRTMIPQFRPELAPPAGLSFPDVQPNNWFYGYVAWAYAHDFVEGYPDGTFQPNAPITRQELAAMVARASGVPILPAGDFPFPDADEIQNWALDYVYTVYRRGWMIGDTGTLTIRPRMPISRAETAAVFFRVLGRGATNMSSIQPVFDLLRIFPDVSNSDRWYFFYVVEASHTHHFTMHSGVERWTSATLPPR